MKYIKQNYKFMLILVSIVLFLSIRFPYYIDAPGGISDMNSKIEMKSYESNGTFNVAYVKEYRQLCTEYRLLSNLLPKLIALPCDKSRENNEYF